MLEAGASLIASGGIGALLKVGAALLENRSKIKREKEAHETARTAAHNNATIDIGKLFYGEGPDATRTRVTRRVLAIMFVATFCGILALWAWYPAVEITVYQPTGDGTMSLLFGLIEWQPSRDHRMVVTTGALVWAAMHPLTMILTAYFMPVGSR